MMLIHEKRELIRAAEIDAFTDIFMRRGASELKSLHWAIRVVHEKHICDSCKTIYLNDSVFCKKCGTELVGVNLSSKLMMIGEVGYLFSCLVVQTYFSPIIL